MSKHTKECELGSIAVLCALMFPTVSTSKLFPLKHSFSELRISADLPGAGGEETWTGTCCDLMQDSHDFNLDRTWKQQAAEARRRTSETRALPPAHKGINRLANVARVRVQNSPSFTCFGVLTDGLG